MTTKVLISFILTLVLSNGVIAQVIKTDRIVKLLGDRFFITNEVDGLTFETKHNVSIAEYDLFMCDIRDSIAIETLYFSIEDDKECPRYLSIKKKPNSYYYSERELIRSKYYLNRKIKKLYTEEYHIPILHFLYLPSLSILIDHPQMRFDNRTLHYETDLNKSFKYADTSTSASAVPIHHNHLKIASRSNMPHDIPYTLGQILPIQFRFLPPYNLSHEQYLAYLDWKTKKLNKELIQNKITAKLQVTPIFNVDTIDFIVPGNELKNNWNITREEYDAFINHTMDSLLRETLYFEIKEWKKSNKFIIHPTFYFDEGALEYVEYDPSDLLINRLLFPLNYKAKIDTKDAEISLIIEGFTEKTKDTLSYSYRILNISTSLSKSEPYKLTTYKTKNWLKIDTMRVNLRLQEDVNTIDDFMKNLSYEQALAFYNWKFPISKIVDDSDWKQFIFPSQEEFDFIRLNPNLSIPDKKFSYPTTTLKYQIRIE